MSATSSSTQSLSSQASQSLRDHDETAKEKRMEKARKHWRKVEAQEEGEKKRRAKVEQETKEIQEECDKRIEALKVKYPAKAKVTFNDKDCAYMEDTIMGEEIPKKYAMYFDRYCYDARELLKWVRMHPINPTLPHNRQPLTSEDVKRIEKKGNAPSSTATAPQAAPAAAARAQQITERQDPGAIICVAIGPNGKIAVLYEGGLLLIYSQRMTILITMRTPPDHTAVAWSPDGSKVATSGSISASSLHVYNADSGQVLVMSQRTNHRGSIAWHPNGRYVLASGMDPSVPPSSGPIRYGVIRFVFTERDSEIVMINTGEVPLKVSYHPNSNGTQLVVMTSSGLRLFENNGGRLLRSQESALRRYVHWAWSPNEPNHLLMAHPNGSGRILNIPNDGHQSHEVLTTFRLPLPADHTLVDVHWTRTNLRVASIPRNRADEPPVTITDVPLSVLETPQASAPPLTLENNQSGGKSDTHTYNGRTYKVRMGPKGGRYILVGKQKTKHYL
jgi:hypothetical protein